MKTLFAASMRTRLTIAFTVATALLLLLSCSAMVALQKREARDNADHLLTQLAREMSGDLKDAEWIFATPAALIKEEGDEMNARGMSLFVVDAQNRILAHNRGPHPAWPQPDSDWQRTAIQWREHRVILASPWEPRQRELRHLSLALLGLGTLVTIAASGGAWLLVGHALSPIAALARQAEAEIPEQIQHQLQAPSNDAEIVGLVTTLNGFLTRLSKMSASKGRFYAAASHELRTPLQALSGHLEVALSRPRSEQDYRDALQTVQRQTRRLIGLTQALLTLNQLEAAPDPPPAETVDMTGLCEQCLNQLAPAIKERGLKVQSNLEEVELLAPPTHLEMLVRNLLENAIKYAPNGGHVRVCLSVDSTNAAPQLTIWNECAFSIETGHIEKWFEPFYRPDESRHWKSGGNGLGLAICKAVTVNNNWTLSLHLETQGIRAHVIFSDSQEDETQRKERLTRKRNTGEL